MQPDVHGKGGAEDRRIDGFASGSPLETGHDGSALP